MGRKKKQRKSDPVERDEDLQDDEAEPEPEPELAEKPKGPNARLARSQRWTKRSDNLMKYSAADVGNATMEFIGPGARDALLRYNGGSKMAAAGEVEAAKGKALDIAKHAKEVAKHAKATADDAEFLVKALDTAYIDLLTGQGSFEDVEAGKHRESKGPPPAPKQEPAAEAPAQGAEIVPAGAPPVQAKEVADALLDAMERRAAERAQAQQPEEVAVVVDDPARQLPAPRVGRVPTDVPGISKLELHSLDSPATFRDLGREVAKADKILGTVVVDVDGYVSCALDGLADLREGAPAPELTEEERAEFRAGLLEEHGIVDAQEEPAEEQEPQGPPTLREYLGRAREQARKDAPHDRQLHDSDKLYAALMAPPELYPCKEVLFVAYLETYQAEGGKAAPEGVVALATETTAPKKRGRRRGRGS